MWWNKPSPLLLMLVPCSCAPNPDMWLSEREKAQRAVDFASSCSTPPPTEQQMNQMNAKQLFGALEISKVAYDNWVNSAALNQPKDPCSVAWGMAKDQIRDRAIEKGRLENAQMLLNPAR
jgi:hypothetical protein